MSSKALHGSEYTCCVLKECDPLDMEEEHRFSSLVGTVSSLDEGPIHTLTSLGLSLTRQLPVANTIVTCCLNSTSCPETSSTSNRERIFAVTVRISAQAKLYIVVKRCIRKIKLKAKASDTNRHLLLPNARMSSSRKWKVGVQAEIGISILYTHIPVGNLTLLLAHRLSCLLAATFSNSH